MPAGLKDSVVDWLVGLVRANTDIQAVMGADVRIRWIWAQPDEKFPYLTHNLTLVCDPEIPFVYQGRWIVDSWFFGPSGRDASMIRNAMVAQFHRLFYAYDGANFQDPRIWYVQDGEIPQDDARIWRTSIEFGIRLTATGDLQAVLDREGL